MLNREYLKEAGLRESDLPPANHPLLENNNEVRTLTDLIDARENPSQDEVVVRELEGSDEDLNVSEALTFPHKPRDLSSTDVLPDVTDFDADARTATGPDDEDDASYMTRADFEASMDETDPDPNTGMNADELLGAGLGRAADITGTVQGIAPGMASHVPLDLGASGFQIMEPEAEGGDPRLQETEVDEDEDVSADLRFLANESGRADLGHGQEAGDEQFDDELGANPDQDGGRIPTRAANPANRDESLDATRRIQ